MLDNFDYNLKVISMPTERLERLEDLGHVSFPKDFRAEIQEEDRPLHDDEQPGGDL